MNNDLWNMFDKINIIEDKSDEIKTETNIEIETHTCSNCKTCTLKYEDGYYYCVTCGIFQKQQLSHDSEYRFYGDSDNKASNPERVGMPTNNLLPESSLGSLISYRAYDSHNFKKMVKYNSWNAMPYKERSQWKVFIEIANKAHYAGLPSIIIEEAKSYYKIISENNISRGSNRSGLIAACLYMACKKEKVPRSAKEIAEIFGIELHNMTRGCKRFKEVWRLSKKKTNIRMRSSNSLDYIDRYCSNLKLPNELKYISEFVAVRAIISENNLVEDNTSPSIAAGSIFMVCNLCNYNITKKLVSEACKISEVTISKCYKKMNKNKLYLLPNIVIKQYNIK
jgi:transcription initiation factor TFIIB